jgi:TetR/AcrR family transcriptional regulator, transcriptional repressor for nem operon
MKTTRREILTVTRRLVAHGGYSGWSYAPLSEELGITKASLHYHFPTKETLVSALIQHERESRNQRLAEIMGEREDLSSRLRSWEKSDTAEQAESDQCLTSLLADFSLLPASAQSELRQLLANETGWLTRFHLDAQRRHDLSPDTDPESAATHCLALKLGRQLLGAAG